MPVDYVKDGAIATFTLRSGSVNPISPSMHRQMHEHLVDFLADPNIRVGILTGAGERAFSAGDDLSAPSSADAESLDSLIADLSPLHELPDADRDMWGWSTQTLSRERFKPIVGAVRGWCLGGGLGLLLTLTDVRVASEDAKFGFPEIAFGMAGAGGMFRLGRHLPHTAAMSMLLTGDPIEAAEALRVHLVNEVVPADKVLARATSIALRIAEHPPLAIRLEMEAYTRGMEMSRLDALAFAERIYQLQRFALGESESQSWHQTRTTKEAGNE